ncbi:hypothetical protein U1Q18_022012 [Sarracenia purpurea var. burkii]
MGGSPLYGESHILFGYTMQLQLSVGLTSLLEALHYSWKDVSGFQNAYLHGQLVPNSLFFDVVDG